MQIKLVFILLLIVFIVSFWSQNELNLKISIMKNWRDSLTKDSASQSTSNKKNGKRRHIVQSEGKRGQPYCTGCGMTIFDLYTKCNCQYQYE